MRIAFLNSAYPLGSTGRIIQSLEARLGAGGHEVFVAFGHGQSSSDHHFASQSRLQQVVSVGKTRAFGKHGFYDLRSTARMLQWLESVTPDLVHLHNLHGHYLNLPMIFSLLLELDVPVIWTLHDCWALTGHCTHFDYNGCTRWETGCFACPNLASYPRSLLFDRSKSSWKEKAELFSSLRDLRLIVPSNWLGGLVARSHLRNRPVQLIHNGVDLSIFHPSSNPERAVRDSKSLTILGMATKWLDPRNRRVVQEIAQNLSPHDRLLLVGTKPKDLPSSLGLRAEAIDFVASPIALAELYRRADVFVNLTLEDTFPTVNLEALACGTPVITFDSGGSPEAVDRKTGAVVRRGDASGVLIALEQFRISDRQSFRDACATRAAALYDRDRTFDEHLTLYGLAMGSRRSTDRPG